MLIGTKSFAGLPGAMVTTVIMVTKNCALNQQY